MDAAWPHARTSQPWTRPHRAVLDAYGWPHDLSDEVILTRLVARSGERVAGQEQRAYHNRVVPPVGAGGIRTARRT